MAENTIDNLSIEVTASADKAASMFDRLASSAGRLRGAASGAAGGMQDMAQGARDAGTAMQQAGTQSGRARSNIKGVGNDAKNAGDNAKKGASGVSVFWNALKRVGSISFKGIKGALYDLPKYFGGKLISNVRQAVSGIDQFFSSIKRIAFYRAIRTALKLITQGFSEGIQNLYAWSAAVNGSFAASMDRLATSSLYLKNSLGAMVSPLIEAIAPAVDFIVDKFVNLLNVINQVFAVLAGKTSYTAAKKVAAQWQDASDSASGSAKKAANEIKRTLLGFDEINKLNGDTPKNGTGSGGISAAKNAGSMMFENRDISGLVRNMVEGGDFSLVGRTVADKINKALGSINWESIKLSAVGITDSITSMINGFIQDIDPNVIGKSLAEVINTATTVIDRFWSSIEWAEAGRKTRQAIVKFFSEINVAKAADALTGKFRSIVTYIANALPQSPQEWDLIGTKISGFINRALTRIPWPSIGNIAGNLLVGGLRVMKILADNMTLTNIAKGIKTAIQSACEKITAADVASWVNSVLKDVLSAVGVLLSIDLKFGNVTVNPLTLITFGVAATSLLKNSIGKIFGATSVSGLGKGLAFTAGVALGIQAIVDIADVINGIKSNGKVNWSKVGSFIKNSAMSTGMFLMATGHYRAGIIALGIGLVAEPVINRITDIIKDIKENGFSASTFWDIIKTVLTAAIPGVVALGSGIFKAKIGMKLGLSSVAMDAAGSAIGSGGLMSSFIAALKAMFSSALGATFGSVALMGGAVVLTTYIAMKIIPEEVDFESSKRSFENNPTDPVSVYSDPLMGGNVYGTNNPSQLKYLPGFEGDPTMVVGVDYVANGNKSYKNSTLGKYLTDTMAKVKSEVTTKVKSVAGTLTKIVSGKLVPITGDTTTTNTVKSVAGAVSTYLGGKIAPVMSDTATTNTVSGRAGLGMKLAGMAYQNIVGDTSTTNTVKGAAGAGMAYTWDGFMPITKDTLTTNTVKAAPGAGMTYTWDGYAPITKDTVTTNTVNAVPGTNMSSGGWLGGLTARVGDTSAIATINAVAGSNMNDGFSWWGSGNLTPNVSDTSASASVNAYAGDNMVGGSWWGGLTPNVEDTSSSVWVDADTPWWYWGKSLLSWIGADNLQTTLWINAAVSNIQQTVSSVQNTVANVSSAISSAFSKAKGGIFSNGAWSDIPQYASGRYGVNHGSLFWAGENGAEIVGTAGGRTEVLNRSQIASAMYSAVQAAMAPAAANFASAAESMGGADVGFDLETLAEMVRQGVEQAMSRSNDLDRQRNEYLRQINDKDFTAEVTSDSINNAQRRMNRRAGTTVVAVG